MKKVLLYTSALFMVLLFSQCGPTMQEAMDYNDDLIADQISVINDINDLETAIGTFDPTKIEPALDNAKIGVTSAMASLTLLGGFYENNEFHDATMKLYELFDSQLNNEYSEQLEIYKLSVDDYTTKEEERFNQLSKAIGDRYDIVFEIFLASQRKFADTWGFTLEAN